MNLRRIKVPRSVEGLVVVIHLPFYYHKCLEAVSERARFLYSPTNPGEPPGRLLERFFFNSKIAD